MWIFERGVTTKCGYEPLLVHDYGKNNLIMFFFPNLTDKIIKIIKSDVVVEFYFF